MLRFVDDSTLHVRLWADCSGDWPRWGDYSFHYQAGDGQLRFRFDNTPDHSELSNYPHHLHVGDELRPEGPPTLREVVDRIRAYLGKQ